MDGESTKVACPSCNKKFDIKSILLHFKKSRDNCEEKITKDQYDYILSLTQKAKGEKRKQSNKKYQTENSHFLRKRKKIYYDKNKEEMREKQSKYKKKNRTRINKWQSNYNQINREQIRNKLRDYRRKNRNKMNKDDRYLAFKRDIIDGPSFVCHSCNRCLFIKSIRILTKEQLKNLRGKLDLPFLRAIGFGKLEKSPVPTLCINCLKLINNNKIPSSNVSNGLQLEKVPNSLKLTDLEQQLIARTLLFIKIKQLPNTPRMKANFEKIVCVPIELEDIYKTESQLPRHPQNAKIIAVQLKRKIELKTSHLEEHIRPKMVVEALKTLKKCGNPFYQTVEINGEFMNQEGDYHSQDDEDVIENVIQTLDVNVDAKIDKTPKKDTSNEGGINDESEAGLEAVQKYQSNQDSTTCLFPREMAQKMVVNNGRKTIEKQKKEGMNSIKIAPGEGKMATNFMREEHIDVKAFPIHHPNGEFGLHHKRKFKLSPVYYFNQRLLNADERFSKDTCYLFMASYFIERFGLERQINLSGKANSIKKPHFFD